MKNLIYFVCLVGLTTINALKYFNNHDFDVIESGEWQRAIENETSPDDYSSYTLLEPGYNLHNVNRAKRQIFTRPRMTHWERGDLYYTVKDNFTPTDRQFLLTSMLDIEKATCIRFKERTNEQYYVTYTSKVPMGLQQEPFAPKHGCFVVRHGETDGRPGSARMNEALKWWAGGQGGVPIILDCFQRISEHAQWRKTAMIHETLHALGFGHEHQRPDRDQYINLDCNQFKYSIIPQVRRLFNQCIVDESVSTKYPYDIHSIMQYDGITLGGGLQAATAKDGTALGKNLELSQGDIERINTEYKCAGRMNRPSELKKDGTPDTDGPDQPQDPDPDSSEQNPDQPTNPNTDPDGPQYPDPDSPEQNPDQPTYPDTDPDEPQYPDTDYKPDTDYNPDQPDQRPPKGECFDMPGCEKYSFSLCKNDKAEMNGAPGLQCWKTCNMC